MRAEQALLQAFEAGRIDPQGFSHRDHVRVGWAMLGPAGLPFHEAYARYRRGLVALTAAAGAPEKYSETRTLGWLALIHEALEATGEGGDFAVFERRAPLHGGSLAERYASGGLQDDAARRGLVLP